MALAKNIRYLRKKQGWGQDTLAEKLGYKSYTTIQKWESGVSEPPLKALHKLAALFNIDINDLANTDLETESALNVHSTPEHSKRDVTDEDIKFALFGGDGEITDAMYDEVKKFAAYIKQRDGQHK